MDTTFLRVLAVADGASLVFVGFLAGIGILPAYGDSVKWTNRKS